MDRVEKEAVFSRIYAKHFNLIFRVAYSITLSEAVSEELSQEAFLRYYERIEKLPVTDEARYWLLRVVRNLCYNHEKRKGREARANQRSFYEPKSEAVNEGEAALLAGESRELVRLALEKIPFNLRTVLVMKEYGNMNYKEISRTLGISEGNVKIRVFRARQLLQDHLKKGEVHVP
jgi:RNA polymerase sigma-70 factor (ECF subfamily)